MKALLVIDMINDFLKPGAVLEVPMGREIIPNIIKHINESKKGKAPIYRKDLIFVSDAHNENDREFKYWPRHAVIGTNGVVIFDKLRHFIITEKIRYEYINKQTYSGFFHTKLDDLLKYKKVDKVYITGILTNICVFITAVEAQMRGYETYVYKDSVATLMQEENIRTLEQLGRVFKIKVI